ncbi:hypothetical protein ACWCPF_44190 [Streptomyces sp. NPDC001858]
MTYASEVAELLHGLNDEEYEVAGPSCGMEDFIVFGEYGFFSSTDCMYMEPSGSARRVRVRP